MKIQEVKIQVGAQTSEELFGVDFQPEAQCPHANAAQKEWGSCYKQILRSCKELSRIDGAEEEARSIDWEISTVDIGAAIEELRRQCENLRAWGQGWKGIAHKLIEERSDITDLIVDKFSIAMQAHEIPGFEGTREELKNL